VSLWTSLEPASSTVDPGSRTTVRLRLRNTGDVVDEYRFEAVGDVAPWTIVEPQTLRLYPGTTGTVELTFEPPRGPDAVAGPNAYAVRITPTEHPEATTVPEGNLTITPFTEVRAELVPATVKGRFRGRPKPAVDNPGNPAAPSPAAGIRNLRSRRSPSWGPASSARPPTAASTSSGPGAAATRLNGSC